MTLIEKIKFTAKYSVKYLNGKYYISGFDHVDSITVEEEEFDEVVEQLPNMSFNEWQDFMSDFNNKKG